MSIVKESTGIISEPLTYIINLSIQSGIVPDGMKIARVIPIFKNGDSALFTNYRTVSVLPVLKDLYQCCPFFLNYWKKLYTIVF